MAQLHEVLATLTAAIRKHLYTVWIDQADKGRERAKDEAELARDPSSQERVG